MHPYLLKTVLLPRDYQAVLLPRGPRGRLPLPFPWLNIINAIFLPGPPFYGAVDDQTLWNTLALVLAERLRTLREQALRTILGFTFRPKRNSCDFEGHI